MTITINAKSSTRSPYKVDFTYGNDKLQVFCSCPAGEWGKFCKHKWQLLNADYSMLYDSNQKEKYEVVLNWIKASSFKDLFLDFDHYTDLKKEMDNKYKKIRKKVEEKILSSPKMLEEDIFIKTWKDISELEITIAYINYCIKYSKKKIEMKFKNGF